MKELFNIIDLICGGFFELVTFCRAALSNVFLRTKAAMKISRRQFSCSHPTFSGFRDSSCKGDEPADLLALLSPSFKSIISSAPTSTAAMDPLPSVDGSVHYQRNSERPSGQEERQVSNDREERQRRQADLCQKKEKATGSR